MPDLKIWLILTLPVAIVALAYVRMVNPFWLARQLDNSE
jgi:hypothetical protein